MTLQGTCPGLLAHAETRYILARIVFERRVAGQHQRDAAIRRWRRIVAMDVENFDAVIHGHLPGSLEWRLKQKLLAHFDTSF